jgi:hypothetical protein
MPILPFLSWRTVPLVMNSRWLGSGTPSCSTSRGQAGQQQHAQSEAILWLSSAQEDP